MLTKKEMRMVNALEKMNIREEMCNELIAVFENKIANDVVVAGSNITQYASYTILEDDGRGICPAVVFQVRHVMYNDGSAEVVMDRSICARYVRELMPFIVEINECSDRILMSYGQSQKDLIKDLWLEYVYNNKEYYRKWTEYINNIYNSIMNHTYDGGVVDRILITESTGGSFANPMPYVNTVFNIKVEVRFIVPGDKNKKRIIRFDYPIHDDFRYTEDDETRIVALVNECLSDK